MNQITKKLVSDNVAVLGGEANYDGNNRIMWLHKLPQHLVDVVVDEFKEAPFQIKKHVQHRQPKEAA